MVARVTVVALTSLIAAGCTVGAVSPPEHVGCGPAAPIEENAVRVAALSYLMAQVLRDFTEHKATVELMFIGSEEQFEPGDARFLFDPTPEVLASFESHTPPVKPVSDGFTYEWRNRGRLGPFRLLFATSDICWSRSTAVVRTVFDGGGDNYRAYDISLTKRKDEWVVVARTPTD